MPSAYSSRSHTAIEDNGANRLTETWSGPEGLLLRPNPSPTEEEEDGLGYVEQDSTRVSMTLFGRRESLRGPEDSDLGHSEINLIETK